MFKVVGAHVPPPAIQSPLLWGTQEHLVELFGSSVASITSVERDCVWRFETPEAMVAWFRRWYGPVLKAFESLDARGQSSLASALVELVKEHDRKKDGGSVAVPATYLETVIKLD